MSDEPSEQDDAGRWRKIREIAEEIWRKWPNMYTPAIPYVKAMLSIDHIDSRYGCESADEIVSRFLVNAQSWRGEDARRIKAELKMMLKKYRAATGRG